ncbi:ribulose-phosphate 3-epimerase [Candidatus Woesearchaeota archaeon CG_4_10_14_0_8_um_filter_47_5]|nr:MAG: ribulose-phosphate 3-epimerase [Candidatus Woesearchaeota archaeon CG_4_10_14_0_8_um_filter_47_5]
MMKTKVSISILSCDMTALSEELKRIPNAEYIHLDVMDGHFVPNITFGASYVKCIKTDKVKDVHLMISEPAKYLEDFVKAGSDIISFHVEAVKGYEASRALITGIKAAGKKAGLTINPDTPFGNVERLLPLLDQIMVMGVFPGFAGQAFHPEILPKVRMIRASAPGLDIMVDGGVSEETAKIIKEHGANILVSSSFVWKSKDPVAAIEFLKNC